MKSLFGASVVLVFVFWGSIGKSQEKSPCIALDNAWRQYCSQQQTGNVVKTEYYTWMAGEFLTAEC